MLRQSILILFVLFAFSANANVDPSEGPTMEEFIANQIEILDLELELFATPLDDGIIDIASLEVYEIEEEEVFEFDTEEYLPLDFNAKEGQDLDWSTIELIDLEEEIELDFDVKRYLPKDFNPYKGMKHMQWESYCDL